MKILLLIPLLCVSCVSATPDKITAFGGKGGYRSEKFTLVYNNEKSFRDGAVAVAALAASMASYATSAAAETTAQVANTNAAKVATTQAQTGAAVQTATINANKEVAIKALEVAPVAP